MLQKEDNRAKEAQLSKLYQELHDSKAHYDAIIADMKTRQTKTVTEMTTDKEVLMKMNVKWVPFAFLKIAGSRRTCDASRASWKPSATRRPTRAVRAAACATAPPRLTCCPIATDART